MLLMGCNWYNESSIYRVFIRGEGVSNVRGGGLKVVNEVSERGCSVHAMVEGIIFEILRRQVERLASFMEDYGRR